MRKKLLLSCTVNHGKVSGVPPVAGRREAKLKLFIGLWRKKRGRRFFLLVRLFVSPSVNNIKVNITVTPKRLPSVRRHRTGAAPASPPRSVGVDWGGERLTECLLSVVLGVSSRSPTAQHLLPRSVGPA